MIFPFTGTETGAAGTPADDLHIKRRLQQRARVTATHKRTAEQLKTRTQAARQREYNISGQKTEVKWTEKQ